MQWRIYYDDHSTYSDLDGLPKHAPGLGILAIAQADAEVGRYILSGHDYYWWRDGEWFGGDIFGLFDHLQRGSSVKFGRTVSNAEYQRVMRRARDDPGLSAKSAWRRTEKRWDT